MIILFQVPKTIASNFGITTMAVSDLSTLLKVREYKYFDSTILIGHNESVGSVSFSPIKGNYIVSGSADKTLKLWAIGQLKRNISELEPEEITSAKSTILAHDKDINCAKFSPNEKLIASGSQDRSIKVIAFGDMNYNVVDF